MKKIYNFITTRPILILLGVIIVVFVPSAISAEPQGFSKMIVGLVSIDKTGEEYEVSVMAYIPKPADTFSENFQIITAKGSSPDSAIVNISKLSGKTLGFAHARLIFVNEELCEYGLLPSLDYLVREYSLGNNTCILNTGKSSAKEVLSASREMAKNLGMTISDIAEYNKTHVFAVGTCVEHLYSESLSHNKVLLLGVVELKEDSGIDITAEGMGASSGGGSSSESGSSSSSGGGESSSGSSDSKKPPKRLANEGNAIILKEGRKVLELSYSDVFSLNWARTRKDFGLLEFRNYSDNIFTDANIGLFVYENNAEIRTMFEEGRPICEISIKPRLMLNEVDQREINKEFYNKTYHLINHEALIENINKRVGTDLSKVLKKTIGNNIDILDFYESFYTKNTREFKAFLATLEDRESYISKMEIRINVDAAIVE